jgi:molybdopterin synthase catalytic subunit
MDRMDAAAPIPRAAATGAGIVRRPIDPQRLLAAVASDRAGAHVLFLGTARGVTDGVVTVRLDYEAHEPLASAALERLRVEALARFELTGCVVEHRLGTIVIGEASVGIAVSGPHRAEAFAAAEWLMTEIKRQVPIWKCEDHGGGRREWIHPGVAP